MRFASVVLVSVFVGSLWLASCAGSGSKSPGKPAEPVDPQVELAAARTAVAADSTDAAAWFRLGVAWQTLGGVGSADSARIAYKAVLDLEPDNVEAVVHYGLTLEDLNKPAEALEQYQKATELAPDDPLPYINMGSLLYFQYKRTYEAKSALSRAVELDPNNADARFNLGVLFADAHLYREAQLEWQTVLELEPGGSAANLAQANLEKIQPFLEAQSAAADSASAAADSSAAGTGSNGSAR